MAKMGRTEPENTRGPNDGTARVFTREARPVSGAFWCFLGQLLSVCMGKQAKSHRNGTFFGSSGAEGTTELGATSPKTRAVPSVGPRAFLLAHTRPEFQFLVLFGQLGYLLA